MSRLTPEQYHIPVMAAECLQYMNITPRGVYVDATLGGGGHTSLILESIAKNGSGLLYSFDADDVAIAHCTAKFGDSPYLTIVHSNFEWIAERVTDAIGANRDGKGLVHAVLYDLGVSSYQFDHHARGFSFRKQAPLDMRFTAEGETAADLLNTLSEEEIMKLLYAYGEDPQSRRLAAAIATRRRLSPFQKVSDLRDVVINTIPPQYQPKTMARVFQALRIAVNKELERLEKSLLSIIPLLVPGGRIVVMSYHSLEDRIVKDIFKEHEDVTVLTKKPIEASDAEVAANPRARSARLRVAERKQ